MTKPVCGIYQIENIATGDFYIGSSVNIAQRKSVHFAGLNNNRHPCKAMQKDYKKYGRASFAFRIILVCEPVDLNRYESLLIGRLKPSYNTRRGPAYQILDADLRDAAKKVSIPYERRGTFLCSQRGMVNA